MSRANPSLPRREKGRGYAQSPRLPGLGHFSCPNLDGIGRHSRLWLDPDSPADRAGKQHVASRPASMLPLLSSS